ncbi:Krr1-domain-containing protein [Trametopsis cervina]|nr:Krr1-domain-containing protein [Trametopsis cervina]
MTEKKPNLLDESDSEGDLDQLTINEHYAKAFEYKKEREELAKCSSQPMYMKEKYGSDAELEDESDEDSEEAESEDEDGEELTPAVDVAILRTLARIKKKDPAIYEQGKHVFEEEVKKTGEAKPSNRTAREKKEKPLTMRQHALQSALNPESRSPSPQPLTHVKEQEVLRSETIAAFHTAVGADADEDEDDLLVPREKTKDEVEREEEEYREFLQREVGEDLRELIQVEDDNNILPKAEELDEQPKKNKKERNKKAKEGKSVEKEEDDHEFLMNYILNRGWIDRSAKRLPTYREITSSNRNKGKGKARADADESDDDHSSGASGSESERNGDFDEEEFDDVADIFETSYNFRFEEPGADQISRYPRTIASTIRREDTHRKEVRERRKERKEQEKLKKKEEVKRLKSLKMKEIREKLERIGKEGGKSVDESEALQELDLEGDWDPEAHDAQMSKIYEGGEEVYEGHIEKPSWEDDIDVADIMPAEDPDEGPSEKKKKKKKTKKGKGQDEQNDGVDIDEMDADARQVVDDDEWDGTEEMRKQKLDEYMDELYGLEFNDIVGDMPTRFRYTKVQPQAFALDPVDILLATDAELNQYMGLKKLAPYRKEGSTWDKNRGTRLRELKTSLQQRRTAIGASEDPSSLGSEKATKKRKGKKERMRAKVVTEQDVEPNEDEVKAEEAEPHARKRKADDDVSMADDGADDQEVPPKTKRRRQKKSGKHSSVV